MSTINRRTALTAMAGVAGASLVSGPSSTANAAEDAPLKGNLKQSVCKWCYGDISLADLCKAAKKIGIKGIDLLGENEWATVKEHGLICPVANGPGSIPKGWNDLEMHEKLITGSEELLPKVAAAGLPTMIIFSGNKRKLSTRQGLKNCAEGIKQITPLAEKLGVTIIMELLNSKVDHRDYQCDHTEWGVELCEMVGSDRFKLLYDIYHMQIMEGDVIRTIQDNHEYIAHYHTGGVPGRNEIDETQELNYRRICEAILETGYEGYLAQEFIPTKDPIASLTLAAQICDA